MYTNDRLMRLGLRDNSNCDKCGNPDSREHRIATCPKALETWNELRNLNGQVPLTRYDPDLLKEVLGMAEPANNDLVVHAEILQALMNDSRIATLPVRIIIRTILKKLHYLEKGQSKVNVEALLDILYD